MIGEIKMWTGENAPDNYLFCHGQELQVSEYPELFVIMGNKHGGDGIITFCLPNMQKRFPLGKNDQMELGEIGGQENIVLLENEMPSHNHTSSNIVSGNIVVTSQLKGSSTVSNQNSPTGFLASTVDNIYSNNRGAQPDANLNLASIESNASHNIEVETIIENKGNNEAHNNMPPWFCVEFIICIM
jgi:microcystin-dependent protein